MKNENYFFRNDYPTGKKVEVSKVEETTIVPTSKQLEETTSKYSIVGSELYF